MNMKPITSIIVLFTLISSGCLGIIDDINNDIDNKISFIDGEYPQLDLSERIFSSPRLVNYDQCDDLLEDMRGSVYDEMIVQLDQQSYYHWSPNPWMYLGTDDVALAEGGMKQILLQLHRLLIEMENFQELIIKNLELMKQTS